MALWRNRPGFFVGFSGGGVGSRRMRRFFSFCGAVVTGQGSRRKLPDFLRGWWWGRGFPADAGTFHPCCVLRGVTGGGTLRLCSAVVTGQGSRHKLPGFFSGFGGGGALRLCGAVVTGQGSRRKLPGFFCGGWRVAGGGFPADVKDFPFCGAVVTGQGSRRKLPDFLRGWRAVGRIFCKGRGCGARGGG